MGKIKKHPPVKYFVGMLATDETSFEQVMDKISKKYGSFDLVSGTVPFDFTDYYNREMGENILRKFVSLENLLPPDILPDVKIFTNRVEEELGKFRDGELFRTVNLDPGYVSMDKMVLATTKNYRHRIYLRAGIYAEATLYWSKGTFHPFEYTYPDYRTDFYVDFFDRVMNVYRQQVK